MRLVGSPERGGLQEPGSDVVDIDQSRKMDKALRSAGKSSELIVYPHMQHSLLDGEVRANMLRKSDAFLRDKLKL